ncbi:MAG: two component transcriptional regulator, LytTR family [Bacteroidetes bacterium]|nr:two component transcriptional regulator, LytTR family [Bacteroidota bacterium]
MMTKIKSIIIDDESANRNLLANLLNKHCPNIELMGSAASADEGKILIDQVCPELVFLDIKMPLKSGFDLLKAFDSIDFHVIFVSGFDQYAIQAFEFNAVDYILKPIDYSKLITAVNKATERVLQKNNQNIIHFVRSIDEKSQFIKNISLHANDKVHIVDLSEICYILALRGYSEITTLSNQKFISAKTLSDYEELLAPMENFLRVNKSVLLNINHIKDYSKGTVCFVNIKNCDDAIEVSRRKKTEIVQFLKNRPD